MFGLKRKSNLHKTLVIVMSYCCLSVIPVRQAEAAMDARVVALGSVSLYGAAGGALLGLASMAFGASSKAIAKGASLGLYAGIAFGTYVVVSHHMKNSPGYQEYPASSPYENDGSGGSYYDMHDNASAGRSINFQGLAQQNTTEFRFRQNFDDHSTIGLNQNLNTQFSGQGGHLQQISWQMPLLNILINF